MRPLKGSRPGRAGNAPGSAADQCGGDVTKPALRRRIAYAGPGKPDGPPTGKFEFRGSDFSEIQRSAHIATA